MGAEKPDDILVRNLPDGKRRGLGCYLTPGPVAALMAKLLVRGMDPRGHVIDLATGSGRLLLAAAEEMAARHGRAELEARIHGVEIQDSLATWANTRLRELVGAERSYCSTQDALTLLRPEIRSRLFGVGFFDAVIGNPPYLREKDHRQLFLDALHREPAWSEYFSPRQDLQQLFMILGLLMLAPGGELVYLVNPYWLQSDSAQRLRKVAAERAELINMVDFGRVSLFPDAPGQHSVLVHFRDLRDRTKRVDDSLAGAEKTRPPSDGILVSVKGGAEKGINSLCRQISAVFDGQPPSGNFTVSAPLTLNEIGPRKRWYISSTCDRRVEAMDRDGIPLGSCFSTHQGIVSGADRVTRRNREVLDSDIPIGKGIFVLSGEELEALDLDDHEMEIVRPLYRAREVGPYRITPSGYSIIYLCRGLLLSDYPGLNRHLEPFRPLLSKRRECRAGKLPWYGLHWPRDPTLFERPRLVTPRRAVEPSFAMGIPGYCEQSDCAMITVLDDDEELLEALMVVLNSDLLRLWCRHRGKQKGPVREFFGRALEEIPLPRAALERPDEFRKLARMASLNRTRGGDQLVSRLFGIKK